MQIVRQTDNWSCVGCVAAMVTNTTLKDFIEFVGHDGSEILDSSTHPDKRRGFQMYDLAAYMAKHKMHFGCYLDGQYGVPDNFKTPTWHLLVVPSKRLPPPATHIVLRLADDVVFDPNFDEPRKVSDYTVEECWPILRWGE